MNANTDQFELNCFLHTHDLADKFVQEIVDDKGNTTFKRKRVAESDFEMYPELKKIKVGRGEFVIGL